MAKQDYEWDEWIIPPSDTKGHSVRKTFRLQPGHARQMEIVIAQKKFPYRTEGDLIRHAIVKLLEELENLDASGTSILAVTEMIQDLVRDDLFASESEQTFRLASDRVQGHLDKGDQHEARRLLTQIRGRIDRIGNQTYKKRLLARFRQQFGGYFQPGQTVASTVIQMPAQASADTMEPEDEQNLDEESSDAEE